MNSSFFVDRPIFSERIGMALRNQGYGSFMADEQ